MRTLSPAAIAALQQASGLEPVMVVRVYWGGTTYTNYCDRKFETEGLVGKLIAISGIEDVVDINSSANSVSMNVSLDDADGSIKNIYDYNDIHKTYVQVLQWFSHLPFNDAFIIFEGEINSPIVWEEGSRTLKFDIVSQLQDREVGFSAEEGRFDFLPVNLIGQAWPIVFGTVAGSKLLPLNETPTAVLASGFGLVGQEEWEKELADIRKAIADALLNERNAYQTGIGNALKAAQYKRFNPTTFNDGSEERFNLAALLSSQGGGDRGNDSRDDLNAGEDTSQADQYDNAASNYYYQANQYAEERIKLQLQLTAKLTLKSQQEALEFRVVPITQTNLPSGITLTLQINNFTMTGTVVGNALVISNLQLIRDINAPPTTNAIEFADKADRYDQEPLNPKFTWFDGGTNIKIFGYPRIFIASIGVVSVINVWAKNKYGRAVVPREWYTVTYEQFGSLLVTKVTFPTPLESYAGEWQDGDVEIDAASLTLGTNTVDIMRWAIENFSTFGIDETSFATVRAQVDAFPANFALNERMNVVDFLKAVAFQSRCSIWINDRKFFLRFLPVEATPVDTVTDSDIDVASVVVTSIASEELITKFTAVWRDRANQEKPNKIIYRYNVEKYGIHEETYDFFIYRTRALVEIAAQFWMIRKSMSWKILNCKLTLNKLRLEAFDTVTFDFDENLVAAGPVNGIIQKATYDPDNDSIDMQAWLPVRLGEMSQYDFAYPGDTTDIFPVLSDPNIVTGNPWQDALGEIAPLISFPPSWPITFTHRDYRTYTSGTGEPANANPPAPTAPEVITVLANSPMLTTRPTGIDNFNDVTRPLIKPIVPYEINTAKSGHFLGFVIEKKENKLYSCNVHMQGLLKDPDELDVMIGFVPEDDDTELAEGYPLTVFRSVFVSGSDTIVELWAQPAIWAPTNENTSP